MNDVSPTWSPFLYCDVIADKAHLKKISALTYPLIATGAHCGECRIAKLGLWRMNTSELSVQSQFPQVLTPQLTTEVFTIWKQFKKNFCFDLPTYTVATGAQYGECRIAITMAVEGEHL